MQSCKPGTPLELVSRDTPTPGPGQLLVRVSACGVCRTDLHVVDGDLPALGRCVVPGHEIVGEVAAVGASVEKFDTGQRVGIPWLGWTCGHCGHCGYCGYCTSDRENLCDDALNERLDQAESNPVNYRFAGQAHIGGIIGCRIRHSADGAE